MNYIHLRSFKTPTPWAVMSDEDDADCAFSMRKGVKLVSMSFYQAKNFFSCFLCY